MRNELFDEMENLSYLSKLWYTFSSEKLTWLHRLAT